MKENILYNLQISLIDVNTLSEELRNKLNIIGRDLTNDYLIDNNVYTNIEHLEDEIKKIKLLTSLLK